MVVNAHSKNNKSCCGSGCNPWTLHYNDVIMGVIASQITSLTIVYSTVYSDADQRKHQSSASLAFVRVIHRGPENSPHKWPVTRKMFPFDDVIMKYRTAVLCIQAGNGWWSLQNNRFSICHQMKTSYMQEKYFVLKSEIYIATHTSEETFTSMNSNSSMKK